MTRNGWEEAARTKKVSRFVLAFDQTVREAGSDPTDPATAETIVAQLTSAPEEQWAQLAEQMHEPIDPRTRRPKTPSPTTREAIVAHYQFLANKRHAVGNVDEQELGHERYAAEVQVAGVTHQVKARNERGRGFTWSIYRGGVFLRSGYTRGADVAKAFDDARTQTEALAQEGAVRP